MTTTVTINTATTLLNLQTVLTKEDLSMITSVFLIATVAIWIAFDVWIYFRSGYNETISAKIYFAGIKYPFIPLAVGCLLGHFFWPMVIEVCPK